MLSGWSSKYWCQRQAVNVEGASVDSDRYQGLLIGINVEDASTDRGQYRGSSTVLWWNRQTLVTLREMSACGSLDGEENSNLLVLHKCPELRSIDRLVWVS